MCLFVSKAPYQSASWPSDAGDHYSEYDHSTREVGKPGIRSKKSLTFGAKTMIDFVVASRMIATVSEKPVCFRCIEINVVGI
jgi:hypothetical protein